MTKDSYAVAYYRSFFSTRELSNPRETCMAKHSCTKACQKAIKLRWISSLILSKVRSSTWRSISFISFLDNYPLASNGTAESIS